MEGTAFKRREMTDQIEIIVEKAIIYTDEILATRTAHWRIARVGLVKMVANIEKAAPDHRALQTLRRFIADNDALYGNDDVRH